MKIEKTDDRRKAAFAGELTAELAKVPFGTLTKRDLECLILHLFIRNGFIDTGSNRAMANALGINETRLKNYLVDIRYKYQEDKKKTNVEDLIRDFFANDTTKIVHDNGQFIFAIENPVVRIDFEQGMKDVGYYTDTSFNKEIVKVKDFALVAFLFRYNYQDTTAGQIRELLAAASETEKDLVKKIEPKKTWIEVGKDILNVAEEGQKKLELLRRIAGLIAKVALA